MDMNQYKLVNSKSWASMAFVMNESTPTEWVEKTEAEFISPAV